MKKCILAKTAVNFYLCVNFTHIFNIFIWIFLYFWKYLKHNIHQNKTIKIKQLKYKCFKYKFDVHKTDYSDKNQKNCNTSCTVGGKRPLYIFLVFWVNISEILKPSSARVSWPNTLIIWLGKCKPINWYKLDTGAYCDKSCTAWIYVEKIEANALTTNNRT